MIVLELRGIFIANLIPTFGLIFATMAFYTILEKRPEAYHKEVRGNYNSFQAATTELNHAFQRIKFWEFTQPCLYLARALPYISTGRTVEGFQVRMLCHNTRRGKCLI